MSQHGAGVSSPGIVIALQMWTASPMCRRLTCVPLAVRLDEALQHAIVVAGLGRGVEELPQPLLVQVVEHCDHPHLVMAGPEDSVSDGSMYLRVCSREAVPGQELRGLCEVFLGSAPCRSPHPAR